MNFPYRCPQCGIVVYDLMDAEEKEMSCPDLKVGCTLSAKLDEEIGEADADA